MYHCHAVYVHVLQCVNKDIIYVNLQYLSGLNIIDLYLFKIPKQLEASKFRINK